MDKDRIRVELMRAEFLVVEVMREIAHDLTVFDALGELMSVRRLIHRAREHYQLEPWDSVSRSQHVYIAGGPVQCLVRAKDMTEAEGRCSHIEEAIHELEHASKRLRLKWPLASLRDEASVRRVFVDTEFIECDGHIDLVSIGLVRDDGGRGLHCVNKQMDPTRASEWVRANVLDKLPPSSSDEWKTRDEIANAVSDFVLDGLGARKAELWGWYCAFDMVALCSVFGRYVDRPKGFPSVMHDIKTLAELMPVRVNFPRKPEGLHHALVDARWTKDAFDVLVNANQKFVQESEDVVQKP